MSQRHFTTSRIVKLTIGVVLLSAAVAIAAVRWRSAFTSGEADPRTFFYDESERTLYTVPRDTLAPHVGAGGPSGDGVRAVVIAPAGHEDDPGRRRIAYLETYTTPLRDKLAAVQEARKAGQGANVKGPGGDDPFVLRNTLVRREKDAKWYDMTSSEARQIMTEWRQWKDDRGHSFRVISP